MEKMLSDSFLVDSESEIHSATHQKSKNNLRRSLDGLMQVGHGGGRIRRFSAVDLVSLVFVCT